MKKFFSNVKNTAMLCLKSIYSSFDLFRLRKKRWYVALFVLFFTILVSSFPAFLQYSNQTGQNLMYQFPGLNNTMNELFLNEELKVNCEIKDSKLVCLDDQTLQFVHETGARNDNGILINYTVYINIHDFSEINEPAWGRVNENDNYIIFTEDRLFVRYIKHRNLDPLAAPDVIGLEGNYKELESFNFATFHDQIQAMTDQTDRASAASLTSALIIKEVNKSTNKAVFIFNFVTVLISTFSFILISSFILKGNNLFNKGKGFKLKETFKIACFATLQPLVVALLVSFIFRQLQFSMLFSIGYLIRIVYLYFKYLTSKKTDLFEQIKQGII